MLTKKQIVNLEDIYKSALEDEKTALQSDWAKEPYAEWEFNEACGKKYALEDFVKTEGMNFDEKGNLKEG